MFSFDDDVLAPVIPAGDQFPPAPLPYVDPEVEDAPPEDDAPPAE